jgi:proteasome accessory factor B
VADDEALGLDEEQPAATTTRASAAIRIPPRMRHIVPPVSARKTERLLNLVIALLATRTPRTAEDIRRAVPGYSDDDAAFKRMFERDKEELRELGIPLETVSSSYDDEIGYRITRRDYELGEISFEPDEVSALGLAAHVWQQASLGEAATSAWRKLRAAGGPVDVSLPPGLQPRLEATEPALPAIQDAVRSRTPIAFDYRTAAGGRGSRRQLEPWGVGYRHGHWYVAGLDRGRGETRVFRLSRIVGAVRTDGAPGSFDPPADIDVAALVNAVATPEPTQTARLRVRPGKAGDLRRRAGTSTDDVLEVRFADAQQFAADLAGYGADVHVLEPPELKAAIVAHLERLLA